MSSTQTGQIPGINDGVKQGDVLESGPQVEAEIGRSRCKGRKRTTPTHIQRAAGLLTFSKENQEVHLLDF